MAYVRSTDTTTRARSDRLSNPSTVERAGRRPASASYDTDQRVFSPGEAGEYHAVEPVGEPQRDGCGLTRLGLARRVVDHVDDRHDAPPLRRLHQAVRAREQTADVLRRDAVVLVHRRHALEEVGKQFDVTRERIRQIEAKALRKLRHPSRSEQLRSFLED